MRIKQVEWKNAEAILTQIRTEVFINEQGIQPHEEWDTADISCIHLVAYKGKTPVGCARIQQHDRQSFQIGRLAVLPEFRKAGFGKALVNMAITTSLVEAATAFPAPTISLNAQNHLIEYYRRLGFETHGNTFLDAGIEHTSMVLNSYALNSLSERLKNQSLSISSSASAIRMAELLFNSTSRDIFIIAETLNQNTYGHSNFVEAASRFVRGASQCKVRILVKNSRSLGKGHHRLIALSKRLPSKIKIKTITKELLETDLLENNKEWMLGDNSLLLDLNDASLTEGFIYFYAPVEVKRRREIFQTIWEGHSQNDPNLSELNL